MIEDIKKTYIRLRKYLQNTAWILAEKVISLTAALLVTGLVARHLGVSDFGVLSYALSLAALFSAAGQMGLSGLVVREIVSHPESRAHVLGTTASLKLFGGSLGYLLLIAYSAVADGIGSVEFIGVCIVGSALLLLPADILDFWFQAFVKARPVAIARTIALFATSAVRVLLILGGFGIYWFFATSVLQTLLAAAMLLIFYRASSGIPLKSFRFDRDRARLLLKQGALIYAGSIFASIYLKIDQIMLKSMVGSEAVGIYAVAAQLSEAWYFLPSAIIASFFPSLIRTHKTDPAAFNRRFQKLLDGLFLIAAAVALTVQFAGPLIVKLIFGDKFSASSEVLTVHVWAGVFIFMRAAFSRWILIEGALVFSLITQGLGALSNVLLNLLLIPKYGVMGAAYATIISYAMASFLSLALYKKTRPVFWMMLKAILVLPRMVVAGSGYPWPRSDRERLK